MSTVGDNLARATETIQRALGRSDLVVCTGGLGPTEDDLTREAIAAAVAETPYVDTDLERELRAWFAGRRVTMPDRNVKQAWLIPSARALANPLGTAPGWLVRSGGRTLVAMPGVPREMTRMWEHEVEPQLGGAAPIRSRTLKLLGIGESSVEESLGELVRSTAPTVATYAKGDGVHVRVTDRDVDAAARDRRIADMEAEVRARLGRYVWGTDGDTLGAVVGAGLTRRGWRLASAETITRGEIARTLSESDTAGWYVGGSVRPVATAAETWAAAEAFGADVVLIAAEGGDGPFITVRAPIGGDRTLGVRAAPGAELRRRATLVALDLLRRALAP